MIISEIGIRNFKSYGNMEQVVKLNTDNGELILLVGNNGNGKSSLLESIDYTLFNKVKGKNKRWQTLSSLPNRINNELRTRVKFKTGVREIEVIRGQNPGILELYEDGVLNDKAGKVKVNEKIEQHTGMDIETFKSFISMSINDFKNFISLSSEEKRLLLDKLFNLETINELNNILKSLVKDNKSTLNILTSEINTLEDSIKSIEESIKKANENKNKNLTSEIELLKESIVSKQDIYKDLKSLVEETDTKMSDIKDTLKLKNDSFIKLKEELKNVNERIELYNNNQCPTCSSDLTSSIHVGICESYVEKADSIKKILSEIKEDALVNEKELLRLKEIYTKANKEFNELTIDLTMKKNKIASLNKEQSTLLSNEDTDVDEFKKSIEYLNTKKEKSLNNITELKDKQLIYKELNTIFSEDGVKKSIIKNIIKPINQFVYDNIQDMNMPFDVELDESFNATIKHFGQVIDSDSLSTGETKKVNLAILIAYLKLIRTKRHINILFLDEVFSSIDVEGVDKILDMMRKFAKDFNINIFIIHHSILNLENFDRVIRINKDIFSEIEEML